ncbi:hypothetical protein [Streptomyces pluripotens]|uniref:hypothetical protein n=1 Tax=Streptomyces pluripotens TaxID=1355015 RepID=UPI00131CD744|nr:hypothetical protein [Streptomyces pluripotens]
MTGSPEAWIWPCPLRVDPGAHDGDGLFDVEPVEPKRLEARPPTAGKRFRAFDPHQALPPPPSQDDLRSDRDS